LTNGPFFRGSAKIRFGIFSPKYFIKICMARVKFCARKLFSTILFSAKKKFRKNFLVNRIFQFVMFFAQFFSMGFVFRKKITNEN